MTGKNLQPACAAKIAISDPELYSPDAKNDQNENAMDSRKVLLILEKKNFEEKESRTGRTLADKLGYAYSSDRIIEFFKCTSRPDLPSSILHQLEALERYELFYGENYLLSVFDKLQKDLRYLFLHGEPKAVVGEFERLYKKTFILRLEARISRFSRSLKFHIPCSNLLWYGDYKSRGNNNPKLTSDFLKKEIGYPTEGLSDIYYALLPLYQNFLKSAKLNRKDCASHEDPNHVGYALVAIWQFLATLNPEAKEVRDLHRQLMLTSDLAAAEFARGFIVPKELQDLFQTPSSLVRYSLWTVTNNPNKDEVVIDIEELKREQSLQGYNLDRDKYFSP